MTVKIPTNSAAEQVDRLVRENVDLSVSIATLQEKQRSNADIIQALTPAGTWDEVEEEQTGA